MPRAIVHERAKADVEDIALFIAQDNHLLTPRGVEILRVVHGARDIGRVVR